MSVVAIVGATATGKSALADALAASLGGEIICADSMQVYRSMDIGTAKTPKAMRSVPYHCLDVVEPDAFYTAALYQRDARVAIDDCLARGVVPVVCGGTGLYIRAALDQFDFDAPDMAQYDTSLRQSLEAQAASITAVEFHNLLAKRDPQSAALIHPNNVRRVVRAFELLAQGKSYASQSANMTTYREHYNTIYIGLKVERDLLYQIINQRVCTMIADGLLAEVKQLVARGFEHALSTMQAIGYKELLPVVKGTAPLAPAVEQIQQTTRRYAKRQLTWFRRDPRIQWLDASAMHQQRIAGKLTTQDFIEQLHAGALTLLK